MQPGQPMFQGMVQQVGSDARPPDPSKGQNEYYRRQIMAVIAT